MTVLETKDRITLADIHATILKAEYYVFPGTTLTVCCLYLKNGYTVTGESACVNPSSFNKEIGQNYARDNAIEKIWQLEGYLLKQQHYDRKIYQD
jgi:hypothetical protein